MSQLIEKSKLQIFDHVFLKMGCLFGHMADGRGCVESVTLVARLLIHTDTKTGARLPLD